MSWRDLLEVPRKTKRLEKPQRFSPDPEWIPKKQNKNSETTNLVFTLRPCTLFTRINQLPRGPGTVDHTHNPPFIPPRICIPPHSYLSSSTLAPTSHLCSLTPDSWERHWTTIGLSHRPSYMEERVTNIIKGDLDLSTPLSVSRFGQTGDHLSIKTLSYNRKDGSPVYAIQGRRRSRRPPGLQSKGGLTSERT